HGKPQRQARALEAEHLLRVLPSGTTPKELRDRALLLVGFAGAFRRSELIAIDVSDLDFVVEGVVVVLRRSKTDQMGEGRRVAVPKGPPTACPVQSLRDWLDVAGIKEGPVFRAVSKVGAVSDLRLTPAAVTLILKDRATRAGLDIDLLSAHS